jgi:hypothetical protein
MNVYEKLIEARIKFQTANIKMSGHNKFSDFDYFELTDILPVINYLSKELKFICTVSFGESAELKFIDTEKPDSFIIFTSPMSTANLKACHEVQNLGAVETYIKRYLYQNCFEIVENDGLNKTLNPNAKPETKPTAKPEPKPGQTYADERKRLLGELGEIMKCLNPDQIGYITMEERAAVHKVVDVVKADAAGIAIIQNEIENWGMILEKRKAAFRSSEYSGNEKFPDDIPY